VNNLAMVHDERGRGVEYHINFKKPVNYFNVVPPIEMKTGMRVYLHSDCDVITLVRNGDSIERVNESGYIEMSNEIDMEEYVGECKCWENQDDINNIVGKNVEEYAYIYKGGWGTRNCPLESIRGKRAIEDHHLLVLTHEEEELLETIRNVIGDEIESEGWYEISFIE